MQDEQPLEILASGRFMQLVKAGRWEYVRRHTCDGAVAVIATTDADELVIIEQHRVPMGQTCLELPAGLVGDTEAQRGEAFIQAARRELLEETGFRAASIQPLYPAATSPGLSNEIIELFRATQLTREHAGGGVGAEAIQVHLVPRNTINAWLSNRAAEGLVIDGKVYLAAALLSRD